MPLQEDIPDFLTETAKGLAEFLGENESNVLKALQSTPEELESILSDHCLTSILVNIDLLPRYIYPDLKPGIANETVKKVAKVLWPTRDQVCELIFPPRPETAEGVAVKLANLRSEYMVATKLNPQLTSSKEYLLNRFRLAICRYLLITNQQLPSKILFTLPHTEREELKASMAEISPEDGKVLERIVPMVRRELERVVNKMKTQQTVKMGALTDAGTHPKIAKKRIEVDLERGIYLPTKEDLLALATDEKRLNNLVQAIIL